jgi:hypothetical protein
MLAAASLGQEDDFFSFRPIEENAVLPLKGGAHHIFYVLAARSILPFLGNEDASFTYEYSRGKGQGEITEGNDFRLLLRSGESGGLNFSDIRGENPSVTLFYRAAPAIAASSRLSRDYKIPIAAMSGSEAGIMKIILEYAIDENEAEGWYAITDILPAGVRLFNAFTPFSPVEGGNFPADAGERKVSFSLYKEKDLPLEGSLVYYVKIISRGLFKAPPAYIQKDGDLIAIDRVRNVRVY